MHFPLSESGTAHKLHLYTPELGHLWLVLSTVERIYVYRLLRKDKFDIKTTICTL